MTDDEVPDVVISYCNSLTNNKVRHTELSGTAHTVVRYVRYGTHSCDVRHTTDVKNDTHSCHVCSYVNDRSRAIPIQGTNVSRTRLQSYVTNNTYDFL